MLETWPSGQAAGSAVVDVLPGKVAPTGSLRRGEAGEFELAVGPSSRDLRLISTVDVEAPPLRVPLNAMSTLQEWAADPVGGKVNAARG